MDHILTIFYSFASGLLGVYWEIHHLEVKE